MTRVRIRAGHVQPVWAGHPWVFAQAIEGIEGAPGPGDVVTVVDPRGQFLGKGYWSPKSAIPIRILARDEADALDSASLGRRIEEAARWRALHLGLPSEETTGYRLVHAEGDGLPGLIADVYGKVAVVQLLTIGMKNRESDIFGHVARVTGAHSVIEFASEQSQRLEGFTATTAVVRGPDVETLRFRERGFDYEVEVSAAQKTGFYFDQRENRAQVERLAKGRTVLDAFSYVGGFSLGAARGGATEVLAMDTSAAAITAGARMARAHGFDERIRFTRADAKHALVDFAACGKRFDLVIVDPPKLAPTSRHLEQGKKAYRRLNATALKLLSDDGLLVSCSCSGAMKTADFLRTIALAGRDIRRDAIVLSVGQQGSDHPVPASFPEGRYLKCALVRLA